MNQGTRTLAQTHRTPPWCQQPVSSWPFDGVFVLPMTASAHASGVEGVGMI